MQVFVNGVEQPEVFTSIPKTGPLYFVVELLSDNQRVRIIPDALPPQVCSTPLSPAHTQKSTKKNIKKHCLKRDSYYYC
jgi:hypothetical protein